MILSSREVLECLNHRVPFYISLDSVSINFIDFINDVGKLDEANADINQLTQEKESMQKTLETLRIDKNNLERNRVEINAMVIFLYIFEHIPHCPIVCLMCNQYT